jgi:hypothetical protein
VISLASYLGLKLNSYSPPHRREAAAMEYVIISVMVLIALYFVFAIKRGNSYVRMVAQHVENALRSSGEPEGAIKAYLNSSEFRMLAKALFRKVPTSEAMIDALMHYEINEGRWRGIGARYHTQS